MDKQVLYNSAREMLIQEHTRWTSWSLFFLGIIGTTLIAISQLKDVMPIQVIFVFDAIVSFFWLCAILSIRATTHAWWQTLLEIEKDHDIKPFSYHDEVRSRFSIWHDFLSTFYLKPQNDKTTKEFQTFRSVTRVLTILSFLMIIVFFLLTFLGNRFNEQKEKSPLIILGKKIIDRELLRIYPGSKLIDAVGPIKNSIGESIIQLRIEQQSGEQIFVNWRLDQNGATLYE